MHAKKATPDLILYSTADLSANGYGSRATIWRRRQAGTFPQPAVTIGNRGFWTEKQLQDLQEGAAA